jgi:hypothetical protein
MADFIPEDERTDTRDEHQSRKHSHSSTLFRGHRRLKGGSMCCIIKDSSAGRKPRSAVLLNANALPTDPRTCRSGTHKSRQDGPRDHHRSHCIFRVRDVICCSGAQRGGWNERSLVQIHLSRALGNGKVFGEYLIHDGGDRGIGPCARKSTSQLQGTCRDDCCAIAPMFFNADRCEAETWIIHYWDITW